MIRLFAALAVPPDAAARLSALQTGLRGAQWRPREAFHVTLSFYGEVREDVARDIDSALAAVGGGPVALALRGVGAFGLDAEPRAVWAAVEADAGLERLAGACAAAARRAGLKPERRAYRPHVTLAYLRRAEPADVAAWIADHNLHREPAMAIDRFGLYSSWRGEGGSVYRLEAEYRL